LIGREMRLAFDGDRPAARIGRDFGIDPELCRANGILKSASLIFARELAPDWPTKAAVGAG
jgi:hypothetical protein